MTLAHGYARARGAGDQPETKGRVKIMLEENASGNKIVYWVANTSENGLDDLLLFETEERAQTYANLVDNVETGSAELLSDSAAGQLIIDANADDDDEPEFSDRARYVTEQVKLWIANDGMYYQTARRVAGRDAAARNSTYPMLREYLIPILTSAGSRTAPGHVAQELAPNDYARIHWADVADELLS